MVDLLAFMSFSRPLASWPTCYDWIESEFRRNIQFSSVEPGVFETFEKCAAYYGKRRTKMQILNAQKALIDFRKPETILELDRKCVIVMLKA